MSGAGASRAAGLLLPLLLVAAGGGCGSSRPAGAPRGTYAERLELFARLLGMEDRRLYDPLLTGRAAASPDPWVRAKAALAAGRLKDPEATIYLPVLLRDQDVAVRRAAAFASGVSGDRRLVRLLGAALDDADPEAAALAAEALGKLGGDEATRHLLAALGKPSPARPAAARALWRASGPPASEPLLLARRDPDARLRSAALYALARRPPAEARPALVEALGDPDAWAVSLAARGLGLLGDSGSAPELARLAGRPEASVATQALGALERLAASGVVAAEACATALARSGDAAPGVALAALRLLGRCEAPAAAERLRYVVSDGGRRGAVALAALSLQDVPAAEELAFAASAPLALRLGAAEAVAVLKPPTAAAWAARLLSDASARVRATALGGLSKEAARSAPDLVRRALRDPDPAVATTALGLAAAHVDSGGAWEGTAADWDAAYARAVASSEADFAVSALDAAAARPSGASERLRAQADAADPVVRQRARSLLSASAGGADLRFSPAPVATSLGPEALASVARRANEELLTARVTTSRGAFTVELLAEEAPLTVESFASLARRRFFDGLLFHRVVPDFVVQGGDPRGDGAGGPGYAIRDEINPARYDRGAVGMALSGPDTGGSQWFVTLSPQPHLDGGYTVFGRVTEGMETLDAIEQDDRIASVVVESRTRAAVPPGAVDR